MRNYLRLLPSVPTMVLVILFSSIVSRADVTGSIQGVVRDKTQAVVSNAHITVTNRKPISNKKLPRPRTERTGFSRFPLAPTTCR